jgi:hypothetical protein
VSDTALSVIFVTAHYDLYCTFSTRTQRALDALNDATTRFLDVDSVRFHPRSGSESLLDVQQTVLVKENVHAAILTNEDRSRESRFFFAARERRTRPSVLVLPTVIVTGQLHMKAASDAQRFLALEASSFFPVTDATVTGDMPHTESRQSPVVMVKRDAVISLSMDCEV